MKKKVIPVVLSATLLTSFLGTSGALAAENRTTTPVPVMKLHQVLFQLECLALFQPKRLSMVTTKPKV